MSKIYSLGILLLVVVFSCKTDKNEQDHTINIRIKKDPERINPLLFPNPTAREVYQYIHLPLADYDPNSLELTPILIKELPAEMAIDSGKYKGGIYFDVTLVDDATWDNGQPITVEDYLFTMKAINLPLTNASKYREITQNITDIIPDSANNKKCRVIFANDYMNALETVTNIEIYPRYVYDSLNILAKYDFSYFIEKNEEKIKSDSLLAGFAERFNSNDFSRNIIVGSGPYKFISWTADQNIILEKKAKYWGNGKSNSALMQGPDRMVFHVIPDELTAVAQLRAGSIDVVNEISADNYDELMKDNGLKDKFNFYHPALTKHYYININNQDPLLLDHRVRRAFAHLIDVDNIIKNLENGMGVRSTGPVHPIKKTFNKDLIAIPYDVEKAKQLLVQAGWKDSDQDGILDKVIGGKKKKMDVEVLISGQELGKKLTIMLQESAKKVGINIRITEKDFKLIRAENLKTRKFQLVPAILSQDVNAWDDLSKWHSENDTPDGSNDMSYRNSVTDGLINKIISTKDDGERVALYKKIQEQIYQDQPCIFLYAPEEKIVINKKWTSSSTAKRPGYLANTFKHSGVAATSKN